MFNSPNHGRGVCNTHVYMIGYKLNVYVPTLLQMWSIRNFQLCVFDVFKLIVILTGVQQSLILLSVWFYR